MYWKETSCFFQMFELTAKAKNTNHVAEDLFKYTIKRKVFGVTFVLPIGTHLMLELYVSIFNSSKLLSWTSLSKSWYNWTELSILNHKLIYSTKTHLNLTFEFELWIAEWKDRWNWRDVNCHTKPARLPRCGMMLAVKAAKSLSMNVIEVLRQM